MKICFTKKSELSCVLQTAILFLDGVNVTDNVDEADVVIYFSTDDMRSNFPRVRMVSRKLILISKKKPIGGDGFLEWIREDTAIQQLVSFCAQRLTIETLL